MELAVDGFLCCSDNRYNHYIGLPLDNHRFSLEFFFCTLWSTIRYVPVTLLRESFPYASLKCSLFIPKSASVCLASISSSLRLAVSSVGFSWYCSKGSGNSWPSSQSERLISSILNLSCGTGLRGYCEQETGSCQTHKRELWTFLLICISLTLQQFPARKGIIPVTIK